MIRSDMGIVEIKGSNSMIKADFVVIANSLVKVLGEEEVRKTFEDAFKDMETLEEEVRQRKSRLADAMVEALKAIAERK